MKFRMKMLSVASASVILLTGCNNRQREEVELFNEQTEKTITQYDATVALATGKEEGIIQGLYNGEVDTSIISDSIDTTDYTQLLKENCYDTIATEPIISYSGFFTNLGANSVTQVVTFTFSGTPYLMEMLWVDGLVTVLNLEVRD